MQEVPDGFTLLPLSSSSKQELIEKAPDADYFIASGRLPIDREVIAAATKLKMIQRTGVGIDQISLDTLREFNIPLYVNSGVNSAAVAEHTLLLMLAVYRKLIVADRLMKEGVWEKQSFGIQTRSLFNKKVGLIGLGNIGMELVKLLQPFGVDIYYNKRSQLSADIEKQYGLSYVSRETLLKTCDVISLLCAYTSETHHTIDNEAIHMMRNDSILINTARGKLIDQKALMEALNHNRIAGAGLDVHYNEPMENPQEFKNLNNTVLTAHIGGITLESFSLMYKSVFRNIMMFENGQPDQIEHLKI